jgi:hypothetical protein
LPQALLRFDIALEMWRCIVSPTFIRIGYGARLDMSDPIFLTLNEVVERYRGQISEGTLRNWRSLRIGPSFIKPGKAILYPQEELDRWDRRNLVICRPSRSLPLEKAAE